MIHRYASRPGAAALCLVLAACAQKKPPPAPSWSAVVRAVDAPAGAPASGAERCAGETCTTLAAGEAVRTGETLRTAPGARAWIDLGGATLELAGGARAAITASGVRFERGAFAVESAGDLSAARIEAADQILAVDGSLPASFTVRAADADHAEVTVRRGRLTAGAVELRSGDRARLATGLPAARGVAEGLDPDLDPARAEQPQPAAVARGLGAVSARVPGTSRVVTGVRVASHHVSVVVRDGFARTEIEEEIANDTAQVLEGRYAFPVPPEASLSRLALWVGDTLVEGEMVERERAAAIFKGIVDDTVRPRDPALLEWNAASELSLKIFPIPAHGKRKVVLAYDQALADRGGRARYVYPLSLGADRAVTLDDFSIRVAAGGPIGEAETPGYAAQIARDRRGLTASFHADHFTPAADFVLAFDAPPEGGAIDAATVPAAHAVANADSADRFVAVRLPVTFPEGAAPPPRARRDRAVVIDVSHSQSRETLAGEIAVAEGLIEALDPDERFTLLACDSACAAFPDDGLAAVNDASIESARSWLRRRTLGGSSDLAGALIAAAARLPAGGSGQIAMLGDGAPTSGELRADDVAARARPVLTEKRIDLRLLGAGRTVDAVVLQGLARALGGAYEPVSDGDPLARRVADLALALRAPLLRDAVLTASGGLRDVYPRVLPALRAGSELLVLARLDAGSTGEIRLSGDLGGHAFAAARPASPRDPGPVVPRLWAAARIAELEASSDPAAAADIIHLSKQHHVMSRRTSLLVLENDRMFAAFGIPRAHGRLPPEPIGLGSMTGSTAPGLGSIGTLGHGGLGLTGVGMGGGGKGDEGTGNGFGAGHLGGSHAVRAPRVRMGGVQVAGRVPPEVIQRIVRQQFGRFRLCYESGLRNNPTLAGRVVTRFVIARDGSVANAASAGGDLADSNVTACVVRSFHHLSFPPPEAGTVTVTYPIIFSPEGGANTGSVRLSTPWNRPAEGPTATHLATGDAWMRGGEETLDKLRRAVGDQDQSRGRHEALILGLLARGRFPDALAAARRFADLDPDETRAAELLAAAAAAAGEAESARVALDAAVEIAPRNPDLHTRAARAFEAAADEARACAHWRSLAALRPTSDDAQYQAFRCRARLGDRESVVAELARLDRPGKAVSALGAALTAGSAPAYDPKAENPGVFEATIRCAAETPACPTLVILKPTGEAVSPWSPTSARSSARSVALPWTSNGTYRTLLAGGAPDAKGQVTLRAHDQTRTFTFDRGAGQSVAATQVVHPSPGFGGRFH